MTWKEAVNHCEEHECKACVANEKPDRRTHYGKTSLHIPCCVNLLSNRTYNKLMRQLTSDKRLPPDLRNAGSNATHHYYLGCPICGHKVGDAIYGIHEDDVCGKCGQKIDWSTEETIVMEDAL